MMYEACTESKHCFGKTCIFVSKENLLLHGSAFKKVFFYIVTTIFQTFVIGGNQLVYALLKKMPSVMTATAEH